MVEILALATVIAPVTNGLVQAAKEMVGVDKKYLPLIALLIGMILGCLAVFLEADLVSRLWAGGISGLASVGLFEIKKNTVKKDDE